MDLASAVTSFALVAGLVTVTPGLDTALVLRTTSRQGRRAGFAAALGINTGVLVWAVATAVGISTLLTASQLAYTALRGAGALYMVWLGAGMIRAAFARGAGIEDADHAGAPRQAAHPAAGAWPAYRSGLSVNLMNPKIGAFYVALLPQFIPQGADPGRTGALLALVHTAEGLLWFGLLILLVDRARALLRRPAVQRWIDGVAGTVIVGCGVALGLEAR